MSSVDKTSLIREALRRRYPPESHALMFEVADATGARHSRWADAVAVGLWPSRGIHLTGFEFKVSRSDWLRELKKPQKAEQIARFCSQWFLVVSDESIVASGELPETWGLLVLDEKSGFRLSAQAKMMEPKPITMEFLAALMRSASKPAATEGKAAMIKEYNRGYKDGKLSVEGKAERELENFRLLLEQVREFESYSGIRIDNRWDGIKAKEVGAAVARVIKGDRFAQDELHRIARSAQSIIDAANAELSILDSLSAMRRDLDQKKDEG